MIQHIAITNRLFCWANTKQFSTFVRTRTRTGQEQYCLTQQTKRYDTHNNI